MNRQFLLLIFSIITLASCSTAYKTGQTPDDVYYSPIRTYSEEEEKEETKEQYRNRDLTEERQIRMSAYNRRWRYLDNDIYYNPYNYGYNYGYYYNPFYYSYPVYNFGGCHYILTNPKTTTPRMTNLGGYGNGYNYVNTNSGNSKLGTVRSTPTRGYQNSNNNNQGSKIGNTLNKIFNNSNSSSGNVDNTNSSSNRSYSPSSSSSSSSSSGSSSSGSTSRPARSGRN